MKNKKGFVGMGIVVAIVGALIVGGGAVYLFTKQKTPSQENVGENNSQIVEQNYAQPIVNSNPPVQNPTSNLISMVGFISPTNGSSYTLGSSMSIEIETSPEWAHCSNGFYLYNSNNQRVGAVGILTQPGETSYTWSDTSKRYAACGTGVGEIPISVSVGSYKICLEEMNTETGIGQNFYCSGLFTLN